MGFVSTVFFKIFSPSLYIDLREDTKYGVYVENLKHEFVTSAMEAEHIFEIGCKNRTTGATLMNPESSRSHSVFTIFIESRVS